MKNIRGALFVLSLSIILLFNSITIAQAKAPTIWVCSPTSSSYTLIKFKSLSILNFKRIQNRERAYGSEKIKGWETKTLNEKNCKDKIEKQSYKRLYGKLRDDFKTKYIKYGTVTFDYHEKKIGKDTLAKLSKKYNEYPLKNIASTTQTQQVAEKEKKDEIIIPVHNWSSQEVMAYVVGGIFESMGYRVQYQPADSQKVYNAIGKGEVSISHEVWQSAFGRNFESEVSRGNVIDAGEHAAFTQEDMGVPNWVIEKNLCPGLPDWTALKNPDCARNFLQSGGKGVWLEGPRSWHGDLIPQRLAALGLSNLWKVEFAVNADELWAQLARAKREGRGTIIFNWTPNFTDMEGFTMIEFPKYRRGCRPNDGGDGRCGSPKGYLKKAAGRKFAQQYPDAFRVFQRISFTTKDMGTMAAYKDVHKMGHKKAAKLWLKKNRHKWEYWTGRTNVAYDADEQQRIDRGITKIVKREPKKKEKKKKKVAKVVEPEQEEIKVKTKKKDTTGPVIEIAEAITVDDSSYTLKGKVSDKGSDKIYLKVEGQDVPIKRGKFKIERYSPVDEEVEIVAIDQWGNKSTKVVKVTIDIKEEMVVQKLEPLNPGRAKGKTSGEKVALIMGIENYTEAPKANYANLDAKYFFDYARKAFGAKKQNIKLLINEDATFVKTNIALTKWLKTRINADQTDLIIFFAGHGLASNDGKELYLLPQDSDPDLLSLTALSRTKLFQTIIDLKPKSVTMFLDTCYSGVSRDEQMLLASARPIRIVASDEGEIPNNFTIFSASGLDQISSGFKEAKHGIFSYYLMKGLEGKADANKNKEITNGELLAYMDINVSQKALEQGRSQNPSLIGDPDQVLMKY